MRARLRRPARRCRRFLSKDAAPGRTRLGRPRRRRRGRRHHPDPDPRAHRRRPAPARRPPLPRDSAWTPSPDATRRPHRGRLRLVQRRDRRAAVHRADHRQTHVSNILGKIGARARVQAVTFAYESGLDAAGGLTRGRVGALAAGTRGVRSHCGHATQCARGGAVRGGAAARGGTGARRRCRRPRPLLPAFLGPTGLLRYTIRWLMTAAALFISADFLFIPLSGSWC